MNAIKNRIRSREGASITFALLIFLVCAIISGVVIVAGSTAAGRMSQIAQSDQRYYAVTSAAGLLRDDIDGTKVTVTYEVDDSGEYVEGSAKATKVVAKSAPSVDVKDQRTVIADATCLLMRKLANDNPSSRVFALSVAAAPPAAGEDGTVPPQTDYSILNCEIRENVMSDGRLIFEVFYPSVSASQYTLQIVFNANINQSAAQVRETASGGTQTIKNVVTAEVEWKFSGVKKGALAG